MSSNTVSGSSRSPSTNPDVAIDYFRQFDEAEGNVIQQNIEVLGVRSDPTSTSTDVVPLRGNYQVLQRQVAALQQRLPDVHALRYFVRAPLEEGLTTLRGDVDTLGRNIDWVSEEIAERTGRAMNRSIPSTPVMPPSLTERVTVVIPASIAPTSASLPSALAAPDPRMAQLQSGRGATATVQASERTGAATTPTMPTSAAPLNAGTPVVTPAIPTATSVPSPLAAPPSRVDPAAQLAAIAAQQQSIQDEQAALNSLEQERTEQTGAMETEITATEADLARLNRDLQRQMRASFSAPSGQSTEAMVALQRRHEGAMNRLVLEKTALVARIQRAGRERKGEVSRCAEDLQANRTRYDLLVVQRRGELVRQRSELERQVNEKLAKFDREFGAQQSILTAQKEQADRALADLIAQKETRGSSFARQLADANARLRDSQQTLQQAVQPFRNQIEALAPQIASLEGNLKTAATAQQDGIRAELGAKNRTKVGLERQIREREEVHTRDVAAQIQRQIGTAQDRLRQIELEFADRLRAADAAAETAACQLAGLADSHQVSRDSLTRPLAALEERIEHLEEELEKGEAAALFRERKAIRARQQAATDRLVSIQPLNEQSRALQEQITALTLEQSQEIAALVQEGVNTEAQQLRQSVARAQHAVSGAHQRRDSFLQRNTEAIEQHRQALQRAQATLGELHPEQFTTRPSGSRSSSRSSSRGGSLSASETLTASVATAAALLPLSASPRERIRDRGRGSSTSSLSMPVLLEDSVQTSSTMASSLDVRPSANSHLNLHRVRLSQFDVAGAAVAPLPPPHTPSNTPSDDSARGRSTRPLMERSAAAAATSTAASASSPRVRAAATASSTRPIAWETIERELPRIRGMISPIDRNQELHLVFDRAAVPQTLRREFYNEITAAARRPANEAEIVGQVRLGDRMELVEQFVQRRGQSVTPAAAAGSAL